MTGRPVRSRASARYRSAWTPRPWNAYGTGPRLERAAAQDRRAGGLDRVGGLEQLLAALHRARAGHHGQRTVADHGVQDADHRGLRVELARGQLERPADRGHRGDARQARQPLGQGRAAPAHLADHGDARALARHVVERRHPLGQDLALHAEDLGLACASGHHDEHLLGSPSGCSGRSAKQKSRGQTSASLARHDACPRSSDRKRSCRASKVEELRHVRAWTVAIATLAVNAIGRPWPGP